jgi:hypothetical protein
VLEDGKDQIVSLISVFFLFFQKHKSFINLNLLVYLRFKCYLVGYLFVEFQLFSSAWLIRK